MEANVSHFKTLYKTIRRIIGLLGMSARMDLAWLLRDTKFALVGITGDFIFNISTLSSIYLIALRFGGIGGMSTDEVLFMLGFSTLTTGLFILFGASNNFYISRIIGRGQLDHLWMQPLPLWMQLFTSGFIPFTGGGNFLAGIGVIVYSTRRLGLAVTPQWLVMLAAYALCSVAIVVARSYLVSTAAFYAPVAAEEIATTAINGTWMLSTFPLSGVPRWLQWSLITILPEGLMAWFPSLALLGKPPMGLTAVYPFAYALIITLASYFVFQKGMRHYVRTGSNRYVPFGFRR
ncbi:ABC transporter permease [Clostridia bacterium]|nr:ABC transporter permease [Clostridia bacterium]